MKKRLNSKTKISLSLLSVLILILAYLLLPKASKPKNITYDQPSYSVRRVPAPTPTPVITNEVLEVASQPPSDTLKISKVDFKEGGYVLVFYNDEEIGISENYTEVQENIEISLVKETSEGDTLKVVLYDEEGMERTSEEVSIMTTALTPGIILPKDLQ